MAHTLLVRCFAPLVIHLAKLAPLALVFLFLFIISYP